MYKKTKTEMYKKTKNEIYKKTKIEMYEKTKGFQRWPRARNGRIKCMASMHKKPQK